MGFLNHATNNIIIDAVLTERGREKLALNDGTFRISSFSFGDDEIDYSLIEKYGLAIGKEKIIKNTPIYEANPNENIALKYPCISFPNPLTRIDKMPTLSWENSGSLTEVSLYDSETTNTVTSANIEIRNYVETSDRSYVLDANISDTKIIIKMHDDLLKISGLDFTDTDTNNVATYILPTSLLNSDASPVFANQRNVTFSIYTNGVVTSDDFTKYSSVGDSNVIKTKIQIIGQSSGASLIIPVTITKSTSVTV